MDMESVETQYGIRDMLFDRIEWNNPGSFYRSHALARHLNRDYPERRFEVVSRLVSTEIKREPLW